MSLPTMSRRVCYVALLTVILPASLAADTGLWFSASPQDRAVLQPLATTNPPQLAAGPQ